MKCTNCGIDLAPTDQFCGSCGHPVPAETAPPPPMDMRFCPNCGAKRQSDERFCGKCGQALPTAPPPSSIPTSTSEAAPKRRWTYTLGTIVGIAILVGVGFMGYQFFSEGETGTVGHRLRFWADSLVSRLRDNPFPQDSFQGWRLSEAQVADAADREAGETGRVYTSLNRDSIHQGGAVFKVFRTAEQAHTSYEESIQLTPEELARLQQQAISTSGAAASCLGAGGRVGTCRAIAGRTVVFLLFYNGAPLETATALIRVLVDHVLSVERDARKPAAGAGVG